MKFAFKSIVAAAAFVAVGATSAATVQTDGSDQGGFTVTGVGALTLSKNLASALKLANATVGTFGGATLTPTTGSVTSSTGKVTVYNTYEVGAKMSSVSYDTANSNKVTQVITGGGLTQDIAENADIAAGGGHGEVGNIDVRFQANGDVQLFGTVTGLSTAGKAVNFSGLLFTTAAANVSGVTAFTTTPGTYITNLTNLAITTAGFQALVDAFELDPTGNGFVALNAAASNFGSIKSTITVAAGSVGAVPEPSTYALMGLGLVGMSLVARRRAK